MEPLLYWLARGAIVLIQALPLPTVARLGRLGGAVAYALDGRHRRVALKNLSDCLGSERTPREIRALARENFRRIGENYAGAVRTAIMSPAELRPHLECVGAEKILAFQAGCGPQSRIMAIGHFGNFELYARFGLFVPGFHCATTYRGLRQPSLNRLLQSLRETSGIRYFDRRSGAAALKAAMADTGLLLGLLADQHAGQGGRWLPFFGRTCSTNVAPAVFALRYRCPLHTLICYRIGPARWRLEVGDEIPTLENGRPRTAEAITADMNRAFEEAIRRDPANWFWVHNRWKAPRRRGQDPPRQPAPGEPETPVQPHEEG